MLQTLIILVLFLRLFTEAAIFMYKNPTQNSFT